MLYLMAKPYEQGAAAMDSVRLVHGLSRKYAVSRFHFTLLPFGDIRTISRSDFERICLAAASLQAEPFEVTLNRVRGNALVGNAMRPMRDFQRALVMRLATFGLITLDYDFDPHVSLAYTDWQPRNIRIDPISWRVEEFLLVNSIHGEGHELLGRWPLIQRQGTFPF
ncbi:hypothetical protein IAG41_13230 [Sphingomonas sp. JC676]|uniref:2'-5' RNA ligase family protein n=1 Tax=Sphingomonas sp. JC676 TaxID=2768065 RepID=UPI001657BE17|nr:2'-5' RNA ligase family protein [Sphingomonas sp. JC676]MBC9033353.1 hypothetical protein [Sphingomonas sp. JC676]